MMTATYEADISSWLYESSAAAGIRLENEPHLTSQVVRRISTPRSPEFSALLLRAAKEFDSKLKKQKIECLFESGKTLYYSDIANELDMDLRTVVGLCRELLSEGKIHVESQPR